MAYEWLRPTVEGGLALGQGIYNIYGQQQAQNAMRAQQQSIYGGRAGQLGREDELTNELNLINRVAPQQRTQITQQPTMTPFQNLMSNAALVGAIPGMTQQIAPGLLPALSNVPGLGRVTDIFRPDTSYLDDAMAEATRNYQEQVVPGIMAMYGEGQDQARERALRQSGADFMRNQAQMRAGAYERGLGRMDASTQNLLNLGMQRRFENVERPVEHENPEVKQAREVREKADTLFGKYEVRKHPKTGKQYRVGSENFDKVYSKANDTQKKMIQRILEKYPDKASMPKFIKSFNKPEDYERYFNVVESAEPKIQELANHIIKKNDASSKRDIALIAEALKRNKQDVIDKVATKRGLQKEKFKIDWKLAKGIALPLAAAAAAPVASAMGVPVALSSGASAGLGLIQSVFGKKQNPGVIRQDATGSVR